MKDENNNTLKTKGYHFEHNFGHGKQFLAALLASLIILAFLLHTVLDLMDENFKQLRKTIASRRRFFSDLSALTTYFCFDNWCALLKFMIQGLKKQHPVPT